MQIDTSSDLLEVVFTPNELNQAAQLNSAMSVPYLQNMRVQKIRLLLNILFNEKEKDDDNMRQVAWLNGQIELLKELCDLAINPPPIPVNPAQSQMVNS